jgi:hypothetical protein
MEYGPPHEKKPKVNVITWMYTHSPGDRPDYPQGGTVDAQPAQDAYWRCVFSLFHSSSVVNDPDSVRHLLFFNEPPFASISEVDITTLFQRLSIRPHQMEIATHLPADYYHAVTSQMYLVDILEQLTRMQENGEVGADDIYVLLDSDCFFRFSFQDQFYEDVARAGCIPYWSRLTSRDAKREDRTYGHSIPELRDLASEYSGSQFSEFHWAGGEFFCFVGKELPVIARESRNALQTSIDRHKRGLPKFNTEEQLFSYIFLKLGYPTDIGPRYIQRIYTRQGNNYDPKFDDKMIWHLLSEKYHFFSFYFDHLKQPPSIVDRRALATVSLPRLIMSPSGLEIAN